MVNLKQASPQQPWQDAWLPAIDRLDIGLLLTWPEACRQLLFRCVRCDMRPPCLMDHLKHHHDELWSAAERLLDDLARQFEDSARPDRICPCHPYHAMEDSIDDHLCPCYRNFGMLHKFLRARQLDQARDCLALQLARSFD